MKKIVVSLLLCIASGGIVHAELFDVGRLAAVSRMEVKSRLDAASRDLIEKIVKKDWAGVYNLLAPVARGKFSEREFIEKLDSEASAAVITPLDSVIMVDERSGSVEIYSQVVYREEFTSGAKLFKAATWTYDVHSERWLCLNLPFQRFMQLPMEARFRF